MVEQIPSPENKITEEAVVASFQAAEEDSEKFEAAGALYVRWVEQEEKEVGPTSQEQIGFEIRRIGLFVEAGLLDEARQAIFDVQLRIDQEPVASEEQLGKIARLIARCL